MSPSRVQLDPAGPGWKQPPSLIGCKITPGYSAATKSAGCISLRVNGHSPGRAGPSRARVADDPSAHIPSSDGTPPTRTPQSMEAGVLSPRHGHFGRIFRLGRHGALARTSAVHRPLFPHFGGAIAVRPQRPRHRGVRSTDRSAFLEMGPLTVMSGAERLPTERRRTSKRLRAR